MKRVECLIRQEDAENTIKAMVKAGAMGVVMSAVMGVGVERVPYPSLESWVRVEAVVEDKWAGRLADLLGNETRASRLSGGRVIVSPVDSVVAIRAVPVTTS